jgi:large subunit ribosomal protein L25
MRKDITIAATPRSTRGKNEARRLRVAGRVPGVIYGTGQAAVPIAVDPKAVNRILHSRSGQNTIFNVQVEGGENTAVMLIDWQVDPMKENLLHVDLKRIDLARRLVVRVPVHPKGEPLGVKQQGGLHEIITRDIEMECLPDEIPEDFHIDVTHMLIGQALRAGDIPLSGTMKLLSPADQVISHVIVVRVAVAATTETAEAPVAAASTAEPEVLKKGKKEEEAGKK